MQTPFARALPIFVAAVFVNGCGLIPIEVDVSGRIRVSVDGNGTSFESIESYDPNDNEDYRKYKDEIANGQITSIQLEVLKIEDSNRATWVAGQVDVRPASGGDWVEGIGKWEGLPLFQGNIMHINPAESDNYDKLNDIVFGNGDGAIEFRINGVSDAAPAAFDLEITVNFHATN